MTNEEFEERCRRREKPLVRVCYVLIAVALVTLISRHSFEKAIRKAYDDDILATKIVIEEIYHLHRAIPEKKNR